MPDTTFNPGTVVTSAWLNDINDRAFNTDGKEFINLARDYNLSPGDDITAALRAAMATGKRIYIPGTPAGAANDWLLSDDLPLLVFDQEIFGDGMFSTRLRSTVANKHAFRNGALSFNRVKISHMGIVTLGTGSPIYFPYAAASAGLVYWSDFSHLYLKAVNANALHLGLEFNTSIRNVIAESATMHTFFLQGGNTTLMDSCYALHCGPDKAGYRSLGGGTFLSCNGINTGGSNFWFGGSSTDTGDTNPGLSIFHAQLINCNMEDFNKFGLKLRQEGTCIVIGGKWARNNAGSTYLALADVSGSSKLHIFGNPRRDIVGTRTSDVSEGISSAYLADFNVSGNGQIVWDDSQTDALVYTKDGINPKPIMSFDTTNRVVTMGIQGASVAGSNTVASSVRYKLSGDSCRVWGRLTLTTKDAAMAGAVRLTGLPFTSNASVTVCGSGSVSRADSITLSGGRTQLGVEVTASTNYIQLFQFGGGVGAVTIDSSAVVSGSIIDFDITYLI